MSFAYRLNAFAARQMTVKPAVLSFERPVASFTFDDFPVSAFEAGAPVLERYGARGTFYAAGSFCGRRVGGLDYYDEATVKAVRAGGHEIGCHSYDHQPAPGVSDETLRGDALRNAAFLEAAAGEPLGPLSYAHPYGLVCARTKRLMGELFPSARGIHPGLNGANTDLSQLKAIALERRSWQADRVERRIAAAKAAKGWLVFFSHDVSADPSPYGCTPAMLEHALEKAAEAGFALAPVREALAEGLRPACRIT